ncbi:MAG: prepilin-type N-terminal cleavage/methylation domain-containing protein [Planctomycetota bacterium]
MNNRRGFTLIELLVVIAIIALLIGILLPALGQARCTARKLVGATNHRTIGQGVYFYAEQFDDETPTSHTIAASGFGANTRFAYVWMAQVRLALGGLESGAMEAFQNPAAPKDFPYEWEFNTRQDITRWVANDRIGPVQYSGTFFGYEQNELMVGQERLADRIGSDPEVDGRFFFSVGLNETGTGSVQDTVDGRPVCLGVGEHALPTLEGASAQDIADTTIHRGPKLSSWRDPANFIVAADSTVDGESDAQVSPGATLFEAAIPASYCGGDTANFAFGDGHVETLSIPDLLLSQENIQRGQAGDPNVLAKLRRWNNTGAPEEQEWASMLP